MNPGRPKSFCPEQALEQAMQLFWRCGYAGASLADLQQATCLSKSSLYQTYPSKLAWFEAALRHYCRRRQEELQALLEASPSALEYIRQRLLGVLEDGVPRGCMLVNVANEFSQREPAVTQVVRRATEGFCLLFRQALRRAQEQGELDRGADVEALADYLQCAVSGLRTQVKAGLPGPRIAATVQVVMNGLK